MKKHFGILLSVIVLATLSGPLQPASDAVEMSQTTSGGKVVRRSAGTITAPTVYSKEQEEKIKLNWSKLKKGMGFQEIDDLVGPIGGTMGANESLKGHVDLTNRFMAGTKSEPGTTGLLVVNAYYTLEFLDGGLANWQLKQK